VSVAFNALAPVHPRMLLMLMLLVLVLVVVVYR